MAHDGEQASDPGLPTRPGSAGDSPTRSTAPTASTRAADDPALPPGSTYGHYMIVSVLGQGGMGVVYRARQDRPARDVALKVIRPGFASSQALRRFELEAEVLGRLQHPGIAQVFEAGAAGGQPFFAMELVAGDPLTRYADSKRLSTRQRLELFARVCEAVQHAHAKGIIHRDLKPGNILVDSSGQPKILDFGVARLTGHDVQAVTIQTDIGQLIGTVPYMSPEQVAGDPAQLDTRSDVYALGVILYELLTGRLPYDLSKKLVHEAVRIIREEEPTRLSSVDRALRGDIETIALRALEKDRERRYQAASDLGSDITRFLRSEPIVARPASAAYQLRKFASRNKGLVGGVIAAFLLLVMGLVGTTYGLLRAEEQRREAVSAREAEAAQKRLAESRQKEAEAQRALAEQRAKETEAIAEFQAGQLSGIEPQVMAIRLRGALVAEAKAAQERARSSPEDAAAAVRGLEEALGPINLTNVSLTVLDESVFARALKAIAERFNDQPLVRARLLQSLADTQRQLGMLASSEGPQREALELRRTLLGTGHRDTLRSIDAMGQLLDEQGKPAEAEVLCREAVEAAGREFGAGDADTLAFQNNFGLVLSEQGNHTEAERVFRLALETRRRTIGAEHADTLVSLHNLGLLLQETGRFTEAEACFREALETRRRTLGADHPSTIASVSSMGRLLSDQGRDTEALAHYREALGARRRVFGDDHPMTLMAMNNVAMMLDGVGRPREAEPILREVLERRTQLLGGEHPQTLASVNNLGYVIESQGRYAEAEAYYRAALEGNRRIWGPDHPSTLNSINNMGAVLKQGGKLAEAEPYFKEALDGSRRSLGEDHPATLMAMNNMGLLLRDLGRLEESESLSRAALEKRRRVLGEDHPLTLGSMGTLATVLVLQGRRAEAEAPYRDAVNGFKRAMGPDHVELALARLDLGNLLRELGRFAEAESELVDAERICSAAKDAPPGAARACVKALVALYTAWEKSEPGKGCDAKAAEWQKKLDESARPAP